MKIVLTDVLSVTKGDVSLEPLSRFGEVVKYDLTEPPQLAERIGDADAVILNKTVISREIMLSCPNLKFIGIFATGYNNIDVAAAKELGIVVCNVPGYSTDAVAQHVFALLLEIYNRVGQYTELVTAGNWIRSRTFTGFPTFELPTFELSGKTLGIVGFGAIGQKSAAIAAAFGMNVIVHSRSVKAEFDPGIFVGFDELLARSDVITLHCPLTDATYNLFSSSAFANMKDGAVLINTARGAIVDESALRDALVSGKLAGAGIDVLENEPMPRDCVLRGVRNCFITPHTAWASFETRTRLVDMVCDNLRHFADGDVVNNVAV